MKIDSLNVPSQLNPKKRHIFSWGKTNIYVNKIFYYNSCLYNQSSLYNSLDRFPKIRMASLKKNYAKTLVSSLILQLESFHSETWKLTRQFSFFVYCIWYALHTVAMLKMDEWNSVRNSIKIISKWYHSHLSKVTLL